MKMASFLRPDRARTNSIALAVLAFTLLTAALAVPAGAPSIRAMDRAGVLASGIVQAPTPRNLTFYMHNNTLAKDINGVSTPYLFDTLQKFGRNNTVTKLQEVRQDWYLFPTLAGNLTANGSITLHAFVSVSLAGAQINPSLTVSEVNGTGATVWSASLAPGAITWWATPHDLVLALPVVHHTFAAGSTVLVLLDVVSGSRVVTIWYNATWVPTHLILQSDDFARVQSLAFLDAQGVARQNFDPFAANKGIAVVVRVTDPLGGYDIAWVNLTLVRPGGTTILSAVPMAKSAGTPHSYLSTYRDLWNYSGQPVGRYNATVGVLDNSGLYYFQEFYATGPYLASLASSFYIGGLPVYVNVKAMDSSSVALAGATINLLSGGVAVDVHLSSPSGLANFSMAKGAYLFQVVWEGVRVAALDYNASANVSAANPLVIACRVYDPTFQAQDANGVALAQASLIFVTPSGQEIGPYKTDVSGNVSLKQVPVGVYSIQASWRGVAVYSGSATVSSNGILAFTAAVYELTVTVKAGNGQALPGTFVSVVDSTGLVFDAGYTSAAGTVVLRLPAGNYTIDYRYISTVQGTSYDSGLRATTVQMTGSQGVTVTLGDFPVPLTSTLAFLFGIAYAVTIVALLALLFLMWRRKKGGKEPASPAEIEKEPTPPAEAEKKE
jgi:hypothetical protein